MKLFKTIIMLGEIVLLNEIEVRIACKNLEKIMYINAKKLTLYHILIIIITYINYINFTYVRVYIIYIKNMKIIKLLLIFFKTRYDLKNGLALKY